ncbi:MAG: hypothetical protein U5N27_04360 [Rhizobium sp.]|nr:hypothetical protein [Rhizobium sp.]
MLKLNNGWSVTVHRDLDDMLSVWKNRPEPEETSGLAHLGFERPVARSFDDVIDLYPGQMLLTASANFGLPFGLKVAINLWRRLITFPCT